MTRFMALCEHMELCATFLKRKSSARPSMEQHPDMAVAGPDEDAVTGCHAAENQLERCVTSNIHTLCERSPFQKERKNYLQSS